MSLSAAKKRQIEVSQIFEKNLAAIEGLVINRGGARSSKSYSIAQLFIQKFVNERNKNFLVVRKTGPALRMTTYRLLTGLMDDYGYLPHYFHNQSRMEITCPYTKNWLAMTSIDDPEKIKSSEWNYVWMEEATEFNYRDFLMIDLRMSGPNDLPNQVFLSFNPIDQFHWIRTDLIDKGERELTEIHSTYLDNPFLPKEYVRKLLKLKNSDPNYWRIYGEGEWGVLEGLIYKKWAVANGNWPQAFDEVIYGLDFGYNHPTALIEIGMKDMVPYETERIYRSELTNGDLIQLMLDLGIPKNKPIYADNAEPDRITEISQAGFEVWPCEKSHVKDGIDFVKRFPVMIHPESVNLIAEKRGYKWREDKNGHLMDEPVKWADDLMDAERYALYTHYKGYMDDSDIPDDYGVGESIMARQDKEVI